MGSERKDKIISYVNNAEIAKRITSLFNKDEKKADKFKASLLNIALDYSLRECSPESIIKSSLELAELELPLAKNLGQCYIVKYKKDAQAVIGYKGWLALLQRNNHNCKCSPIFECDSFTYKTDGYNAEIILEPNFEERKEFDPKWTDKHLKGVLVSIKDLASGEVSHDYVSAGKIKQIVGMSPSRNSKFSPYVDWNLEMYMGKAIKYIVSKKPMNEQIARAVELENVIDTQEVKDLKKEDDLDLNAYITEEVGGEENNEH